MKALLFDVETNGLPAQVRPFQNYPFWLQPEKTRIMQLGCLSIEVQQDLLGDTQIFERDRLDTLVQMEECTYLDPYALKTHGISIERANKEGISSDALFEYFRKEVAWADVIICHNLSFDSLYIDSMAFHKGLIDENGSIFSGKQLYCTMYGATPVAQEAGRIEGRYKWPKLEDCYHKFTGKKLINAHDAMADILATKEVWLHLLKQKKDKYGWISKEPFAGGEIKVPFLAKQGERIGAEF